MLGKEKIMNLTKAIQIARKVLYNTPVDVDAWDKWKAYQVLVDWHSTLGESECILELKKDTNKKGA